MTQDYELRASLGYIASSYRKQRTRIENSNTNLLTGQLATSLGQRFFLRSMKKTVDTSGEDATNPGTHSGSHDRQCGKSNINIYRHNFIGYKVFGCRRG